MSSKERELFVNAYLRDNPGKTKTQALQQWNKHKSNTDTEVCQVDGKCIKIIER